LAVDLVRMRPEVLFALGGDVTPAATKATQTIPIVFTSSADPVRLGFVASLARPGGNATGQLHFPARAALFSLALLLRHWSIGYRGARTEDQAHKNQYTTHLASGWSASHVH
jgi:ABC transporter substrate binding protein